MNSKQLNLNISENSVSDVIASSLHNFKIELIYKIGKNDLIDLIETSKEAKIFMNASNIESKEKNYLDLHKIIQKFQ